MKSRLIKKNLPNVAMSMSMKQLDDDLRFTFLMVVALEYGQRKLTLSLVSVLNKKLVRFLYEFYIVLVY